MITASGVGSWPGTDVRSAVEAVAQILGPLDAADGVIGLPYVPELPQRGVGADMIGRSAVCLAGLAVDVQPSGWRLVDVPGRDAARAAGWWRQDRDEVARAYEGYRGRLKVAFVGPWTLAAHVRLPRGERVLVDPGACRDVAQSLAEGIGQQVRHLRRLVPGAQVVVQLDEPSLPAVLAGQLATSSGLGRVRAIDEQDLVALLGACIGTVEGTLTALDEPASAKAAGAPAVGVAERIQVHCCAPEVPLGLLWAAGARAVGIDIGLLDAQGWQGVAEFVDQGGTLGAGLPVDADAAVVSGRELVRPLMRAWQALGLGRDLLGRVVVTPACGLANVGTASNAVRIQRAVVEAANIAWDQV